MVYVIGDLHLSLSGDKGMDVFPGWQNYVARIKENWEALVCPEDTVVLAGDTSWGMSCEEALADFRFIEALPGRKVCSREPHIGGQPAQLNCFGRA
jgi:predicted phosphohydrolase